MKDTLELNVRTPHGEVFVTLDKGETKLHNPTGGLRLEREPRSRVPSVTTERFYQLVVKYLTNTYPELSSETPFLSYTQATLVSRKIVNRVQDLLEFEALAKV